MPKRRIFISATNRGLKSFRLLATQSLRKRGYDVDDEQIFNLTWMQITETLETRIARCDAVVCLIGFAFGGEPSERPPISRADRTRSWSIFWRLKIGKPVFRLMADEKTPFDEDVLEPESAELRQLQRDFRAEVVRDQDWRSFGSLDQLRAELAELASRGKAHHQITSPAICPWPRSARSSRGETRFSTTCASGSDLLADVRRPS